MTETEIESILDQTFRKERHGFDAPSQEAWSRLKEKFQCDFSPDFVLFYKLIGNYFFEGELLNIGKDGRTNGDGTIADAYDFEMKTGLWNEDLIPFYSIGNGDCFCLSASQGSNSPVYYVYHEDGHFEEEYSSFGEWLKGLDTFLHG